MKNILLFPAMTKIFQKLLKEEQVILQLQALVRTLATAESQEAQFGNKAINDLYIKCCENTEIADNALTNNMVTRSFILRAASDNNPLLPALQFVQQLGDFVYPLSLKEGKNLSENTKSIYELLNSLAAFGIEQTL